MAAFALFVAFLGGTSRPDAIQHAALRPLCALALIPALYALSLEQLREVKFVALLLAASIAWMILQLVPLPAALWQSLPDRNAVAGVDELIGLEGNWRPISMVPTLGYNALAEMIVPLAAMCAALAAGFRSRELFLIVASVGVLNALLGLAQVVTGGSGPLYFYSVTNNGSPVGIFASENHSSVFSSVILLVIARLGIDQKLHAQLPWIKFVGAGAFLAVLISVMLSGSRAGLATGLGAVAGSVAIAYLGIVPKAKAPARRRSKKPTGRLDGLVEWVMSNPLKPLSIMVIVVSILALLFVLNGRLGGLESALNQNALDGLRLRLWPTLEAMIRTHWMVGTGFGSFEEVYHIYERTELLLPFYLNRAHNDWAQLVIEGGAVAVLLLGALLVWIIRAVWHFWSNSEGKRASAVFWIAVLCLLSAASLVDYPLRLPLFQVVAIWLVMALAFEKVQNRRMPATS